MTQRKIIPNAKFRITLLKQITWDEWVEIRKNIIQNIIGGAQDIPNTLPVTEDIVWSTTDLSPEAWGYSVDDWIYNSNRDNPW